MDESSVKTTGSPHDHMYDARIIKTTCLKYVYNFNQPNYSDWATVAFIRFYLYCVRAFIRLVHS